MPTVFIYSNNGSELLHTFTTSEEDSLIYYGSSRLSLYPTVFIPSLNETNSSGYLVPYYKSLSLKDYHDLSTVPNATIGNVTHNSALTDGESYYVVPITNPICFYNKEDNSLIGKVDGDLGEITYNLVDTTSSAAAGGGSKNIGIYASIPSNSTSSAKIVTRPPILDSPTAALVLNLSGYDMGLYTTQSDESSIPPANVILTQSDYWVKDPDNPIRIMSNDGQTLVKQFNPTWDTYTLIKSMLDPFEPTTYYIAYASESSQRPDPSGLGSGYSLADYKGLSTVPNATEPNMLSGTQLVGGNDYYIVNFPDPIQIYSNDGTVLLKEIKNTAEYTFHFAYGRLIPLPEEEYTTTGIYNDNIMAPTPDYKLVYNMSAYAGLATSPYSIYPSVAEGKVLQGAYYVVPIPDPIHIYSNDGTELLGTFQEDYGFAGHAWYFKEEDSVYEGSKRGLYALFTGGYVLWLDITDYAGLSSTLEASIPNVSDGEYIRSGNFYVVPKLSDNITIRYNGEIIDTENITLPISIEYNGSTIATLDKGDTKTLACNGQLMKSNIVIGNKTLQCNGKLMISDIIVEAGTI